MTMMRYRIPNNAPHQFHIKIGNFKNLEYTMCQMGQSKASLGADL